MLAMLLAFAVSAASTMLLVCSSRLHGAHSLDADFSKPQGFHAIAVPRIGGVGVLAGMLASLLFLPGAPGMEAGLLGLKLVACALPAFAAGLVQDLSEALTPRGRLVATALSVLLAIAVLDAEIRNTGIPGLDWLVSFGVGSIIATLLAVVGVANATNIIDGFNGLAAMCIVIMLVALAYVAFRVGDAPMAILALVGVGAVLGFFLWNFPGGRIFLGDGGAYFLGFLIAEIGVLLLRRNEGEVSLLFPLLVCIYPIFETLFSIYRRRFLRLMLPSMPDGLHLHSLLYRRVLRMAVPGTSPQALTRRNSMTSPYLWLLCGVSVVPAVLFWNNTGVLALFVVLFGFGYVQIYWRIVRFHSPRWLLPARRRADKGLQADNRGL